MIEGTLQPDLQRLMRQLAAARATDRRKVIEALAAILRGSSYPCPPSYREVISGSPDETELVTMRFHLTYEGPLLGATSSFIAPHKHAIRRAFSPQLRKLWEVSPRLQPHDPARPNDYDGRLGRWHMHGERFVPLVEEDSGVMCELKVLILRPEAPGSVIHSGDLDNRIKTVLDALRLPHSSREIDPSTSDGEPIFCLLQDDAMVERLEVCADTLLRPAEKNDVHVVIEVSLRPYKGTFGALRFI